MTIEAYPLCWPAGWNRTESPQRSRFDTSFAAARDGVLDELERMGVAHYQVIISTNVETRRDGLPYANRREPDDAGVAVYFNLRGEDRVIPIDKFDRVKDNMQAIHKIIAALRGLDRWGYEQMLKAAFQGFTALPGPDEAGGDHWSTVLNVASDASDDEVRDAYRRARSAAHTDRGTGSNVEFQRVQLAWHEAKQERGL